MLGLSALRNLGRAPLEFYAAAQAQQGDCAFARLGPYRMQMLFHPDEIEAVLTIHARDFARFERVMKILSQWNGQSLLILEGEDWRARRRRVLPAFARKRMDRYAKCSVNSAKQLCARWKSQSVAGTTTIDSDHEMARLALDIALDALFGAQDDVDKDEVAAAVGVLSHVAYRETAGLLRAPLWWPFGMGARKTRAIRAVDGLVRGIIAARRHDPANDRGDLLSILMAGPAQEARDDAVSLLIAGHETTGAALCWLGYLLAGHPETLAATHREIDTALEDRAPAIGDFEKLPFLQAAVSETLRLYPPAYALFPRRALNDVKVGSAQIRRNDLVVLSPFVTQRDPRWFQNALSFDPTRFQRPPTWPDYAYFPFGAGPRVCIGQQFGLVEITLAMATILQHFTPAAVQAPVQPDAKFSLRPRGGMRQQWIARSGV